MWNCVNVWWFFLSNSWKSSKIFFFCDNLCGNPLISVSLCQYWKSEDKTIFLSRNFVAIQLVFIIITVNHQVLRFYGHNANLKTQITSKISQTYKIILKKSVFCYIWVDIELCQKQLWNLMLILVEKHAN